MFFISYCRPKKFYKKYISAHTPPRHRSRPSKYQIGHFVFSSTFVLDCKVTIYGSCMIRIKRLYTTPVNRYFAIKNKRGWKSKVTCLMFRWTPTMARRCVSWYVFFIEFFRTAIRYKKHWLIEMIDLQFLRTAMVGKWKRLRNPYKKYLRNMVWT